MAVARVGDLEVYFERAGDGPRLLFISGSGGDLRNKPNQMDGPLPRHFDVLSYDQRGLALWVAIMWVLLTVCYAWMPPPSPSVDPVTKQVLRDPNMPVNINYVYNIQSDEEPQKWMDPDVYFAVYMMVLMVGVYLPTHVLFRCLGMYPATKVVVVGPESAALRDEALALGASAYASRPVASETLVSRVNDSLTGSQGSAWA